MSVKASIDSRTLLASLCTKLPAFNKVTEMDSLMLFAGDIDLKR